MHKTIKKLSAWKIDYIVLFIFMSLYYGWIQWNHYIGDPDGFYHAKLATWLGQSKLIESLPWMQFSTLRDSFTDHHLLYHLLLAPFTRLADPLIGVKIATVLFAILMVLTFYWLLKRLNIAWPFIFALSFLTLNGLNFRVSLIKANSLSIIMLWLIIFALFKKKNWLVILLGFVFVWLYGGWPLAFPIIIAYLIADIIYKRIHTNKLKIFWHQIIHTFDKQKINNPARMTLGLLAGLALGIFLNPYWPQNIYFYYQQVIQIGLINQGQNFAVGSEWYGTSVMHIISSAPHLFIAACLIFILLFFNIKKASRLTWFSFFLAFGFMILTVKSRRYVEYYMPFTLLFVASGVSDVRSVINWRQIMRLWDKLSKPIKIYLAAVALVFCTMIMPSIYDKMLNVSLSGNWEINKFKPASEWLAKNAPAQSIVFHSDWDEWPVLFYYNDNNYYIIGLDPTFMANYDSSLQRRYIDITTGKIKYSVVKQIKNYFNANYVFVEKKGHEKLMANLDRDPKAEVVFQDEQTRIYILK